MGKVLRFGLKPVIRIEQFGGLWVVSVRPTPDGIQADKSFENSAAAADYATMLKEQHGWRTRPEHFDFTRLPDKPLDGAA